MSRLTVAARRALSIVAALVHESAPTFSQDSSTVCALVVDKVDAAFPSDRIAANCKKGDIIVLVVPYGHETMLGGARYCDFSAAIVIVDDPEQKVRKQNCRYIGSIRPVRQVR